MKGISRGGDQQKPQKPGTVSINAQAEGSPHKQMATMDTKDGAPQKKQSVRIDKNDHRPLPPSFAFFTNFNESCLKIPKTDRDRSIIPWKHSIKDYLYSANDFNSSGKITTEQLKREVLPLKKRGSWNPLVIYRMVMIAVLLWIVIVLSISTLLTVYDFGNSKIHVWWVYLVAAFIGICFGVILVICAKKHADRLSYDKGFELNQLLKTSETKFLQGTEFGLCAGPNGAWIELGMKSALSRLW